MKKIITIACSVAAVLALAMTIYFQIGEKSVDYEKLIDEECGFEISQYLELDEAFYKNSDVYGLQFKLKPGCETQLISILGNQYHEEDPSKYSYIRYRSMAELKESGIVKHLYSFFREGKVKGQNGERVLSVQIYIYIVEVDNQQYVFVVA